MTLTLAPAVGPSFPLEPEHDWPCDEQIPIKPYATIIPKTIRSLRRLSPEWRGLTADQVDYFLSFFSELRGAGGVFWWTPPDPVQSPLSRGPDLTQVLRSGAPSSPRTYYVTFTWYASGTGLETKPSPASTITVQAGYVASVAVPVIPMGADRVRIYAGTVAGLEYLQASSSSRIWEEPITGLLTLTALAPMVNALRAPILWRLTGKVRPIRISSNRFTLRLDFLEQFV